MQLNFDGNHNCMGTNRNQKFACDHGHSTNCTFGWRQMHALCTGNPASLSLQLWVGLWGSASASAGGNPGGRVWLADCALAGVGGMTNILHRPGAPIVVYGPFGVRY